MSNDPTALAREVLDLAHEDETVTVCSIPDRKAAALARAVHSLTAERDAYREENTRLREEIARVEALADWLERQAADLEKSNIGDWGIAPTRRKEARRIRDALNGVHA